MGYTRNVTKELEHEGAIVTVVMKRASVKVMQKLAPFVSEMQSREKKAKSEGEVDISVIMDFDKQIEMLSLASEVLPDCVISIVGVTLVDEDSKEALAITEIANQVYFMKLIYEIFMLIFEISNLSGNKGVSEEEVEKKYDGLQPTP